MPLLLGLLALVLILWIIHYWYLLLAAIGIYTTVRWLLGCRREYRALQRREAAERRRHVQARREIQQIKAATARAMVDAARGGHS